MESVHRQTYNNVSHMVILESDDQELMGILAPYIKMGWIQVLIGTGKGKYGEYGAAIWKTDGFYAIFLDCNSCFTDIRSIDEYVSYIQQQNCDYCYSDCQIWNVYGCETGAVSERFLKGDITKPVISQVCSPETGDMFYMLHQQGDGGVPTLATL